MTEELKTPFVAKALMAKRKTSKCPVIIFMGKDKSGELKECSRCYEENWGCYFNHYGRDGQRIGMYTQALDDWTKRNSSMEYT